MKKGFMLDRFDRMRIINAIWVVAQYETELIDHLNRYQKIQNDADLTSEKVANAIQILQDCGQELKDQDKLDGIFPYLNL